MTTVKILINLTRPSALPAVCVPVATAPIAQAYALGQPAVAAPLQASLAPAAVEFKGRISSKINNYMGTTSAKGEGTTLSIVGDQKVSVQRDHTVRINKVEGGDAHGIPPRGRPV